MRQTKHATLARMTPESAKGSFVISLDFELMWGMFDKVSHEQYGANLDGVHVVVPRLLTLFVEHGINATWATVGMLLCRDTESLQAAVANVADQPDFVRSEYSAYKHLALGQTVTHPTHYFAPELAALICATPSQEFASHTFSHLYCKEQLVDEITEEAVIQSDTNAMALAASPFNTALTSIVFPRNQWSQQALWVLARAGYTAFRGTEKHFLYSAKSDVAQRHPLLRLMRIADAYFNISGFHTYTIPERQGLNMPLTNIPASRFLRPYSKRLALFEGLRLRRIKRAMTHAAKGGEVYHLWWHPHNFGRDIEKNIACLTKILDHFKTLQKDYDMESVTMRTLATRVRE